MNKEYLKKDDEELQEYLQFRHRGSRIESKKGRGSVYNRNKIKDADRKSKIEKKEDEEYN